MLNLKNVHRTIFLLLITTIENKSPESEMNTLFSVLSRSRSLGLLNPKNIGFLILTFKRPSVYIKSILNCWMYTNIRQYTLTVARGTMFKCGIWCVCYCAFESRRKSKFKVAGEVTKCLVKVWRRTTSQKTQKCRTSTRYLSCSNIKCGQILSENGE